MSLKRKISSDEFESFSDEKKELYVEKDGAYFLDIDDDEVSRVLRAKDREIEKRKAKEAELEELRAKLAEREAADEDSLKRKGKIDVLEKSWNDKFERQKAEHSESVKKYQEFIVKQQRDDLAAQISSELNPDAPKVMIPHVLSRISVDFEDGVPTRRILDASGQPSALTPDELKKEFFTNTDFAAIIVGSKASGSGTPAPPARKDGVSNGEKRDLWNAKPEELLAHVRSVSK